MSAPNNANRDGPSRSAGRGRNPNATTNPNIGRQMSSAPAVRQEQTPAATQTLVAPTVSTHLSNAKTGTGKTIAFLLPKISRILQRGGQAPAPDSVSCLIMSPTSELALQIEREAQMLLKIVPANVFGVQHVVGGTNLKTEGRNLSSKRCDILVATPGRLLDHLNNTNGMVKKFANLQAYILDEADRMLDMGFRQELAKIGHFLPNRRKVPRQALLFSATKPPGVREVADLDPNAKYINTLGEEEANTHAHVDQQSVVARMQDMLPLTLALLLEEIERAPTTAKVIVFSPTARAAGLLAKVRRTILLALRDVSDESKAQSYQASLGYYKSELRSLRWTPTELVARMNEHAQHGLLYDGGSGSSAPPLLAKTVGKMGLRGTPGLNVVRELPGQQGQEGQGQRGPGRGGPRQGQGQSTNNGGGQGQNQGRKPGFRGGHGGHRGGGGGSRGGAAPQAQ
ncbi:hypothetical protein A4X09_0g6818 [Tilletia walkeri]|uniref:ATP-dependent RNA helicase n=1 Tax=Tilletia walkeri TaxID=117179 RepID=A0A8X7N1X2_9BASI|nr:hypothetical protein A4X09_0g6818 [Tilletia walkeri]